MSWRRDALVRVQEDERRRIARELHDGINQQLAALVMGLGRLAQTADSAQLRKLREQADELAQDVRALSHRLHPAILEHLGLVSALRSLCGRFSESEGIPTSFVADCCQPPGKDLSLTLYRIAQEGLHNVAKHSRARRAVVRLERSEGWFLLRVQDDGVGFTKPAEGGLGLTGMAERARLAGGRFLVRSTPGGGTVIQVSVPAGGKAKRQR
jgi:signal transduction histidine kinase